MPIYKIYKHFSIEYGTLMAENVALHFNTFWARNGAYVLKNDMFPLRTVSTLNSTRPETRKFLQDLLS